MLLRELKINLKSFIIWTLVLLLMYILVFSIYPSLMSSEDKNAINELMKVFPEDLLKAFNMDIISIDSAFGWFKTEGYVFYLLAISCFSALLGSQILLKEESDKTIEYLYSKPISRKRIVTFKIISGYLYIFLMVIIVSFLSGIALLFIESYDFKEYIFLSLSPIMVGFTIFSLMVFISTFFRKTKKLVGISLGIVFLLYFLSLLASLSDKLEMVKYFTPFTLGDARTIIESGQISIYCILITLVLCSVFSYGTFNVYNNKDFY